MNIIKKIKSYFTDPLEGFTLVQDEPVIEQLSDETRRWKAMSLELNEELMLTRRKYNAAMEEIVRLEKTLALYQELLADKEG